MRWLLVALCLSLAGLACSFFRFAPAPTELPSQEPQGTRTLVIYAYFEKNEMYRENLRYYLEVGVEERDDVEFLFIIQGHECTVPFPNYRNVRVLKRQNDCFDFGAWRHGLDNTPWRPDGGAAPYTHFLFVNSSVRGPFMPTYIPRGVHWTSLFVGLLCEPSQSAGTCMNGPIKLAGISINCWHDQCHVQSMLWVVSLETLTFLIDHTNVLTCKYGQGDAVTTSEIGMSTIMLAKGWNIGSMLLASRGFDFRQNSKWNNNIDPNDVGHYFGIVPNVHETVFVKMTRRFLSKEMHAYGTMARQQKRQGFFDGLELPPPPEDNFPVPLDVCPPASPPSEGLEA